MDQNGFLNGNKKKISVPTGDAYSWTTGRINKDLKTNIAGTHSLDQNNFLSTSEKKITVPSGDSYSWTSDLVNKENKNSPFASFDFFEDFLDYCVCKIKETINAEYSNAYSDDFNI